MDRFVVAVVSLLLSLLAAFPNGMATFERKRLLRLLPFLAASPTGMERFVVAVMSLLLSLLAAFPTGMATFERKRLLRLLPFLVAPPTGMERFEAAVEQTIYSIYYIIVGTGGRSKRVSSR